MTHIKLKKDNEVTPQQAARLIGCCVPTIFNWILADKIKTHRKTASNRTYISKPEVLAIARKNKIVC